MSREELRAAYREFQQRGGVVDLASRIKLAFKGEDRVRYLNGQVTANIASARHPAILPACVTTAKGKLCGDVFVGIWPAAIVVDADAALAETLPARFERYIVADDVTIDDVTNTAALVHGICDRERFAEIVGNPGVPVNRFGIEGFDLMPPWRENLPPIWEKLAAQFPVLSDELLEVIRIERGVPRWEHELGEDTLPPEAGLDRTHIDYHKGCYIGQEVISRLKSVGHVNRQLMGFVADAPIPAGATIFSGDQPCGEITSATWSFALERPIALGYLRRAAPREGLFARAAEPGAEPVPITVRDLPFTK
jgi:folate-binding protein YgfZ